MKFTEASLVRTLDMRRVVVVVVVSPAIRNQLGVPLQVILMQDSQEASQSSKVDIYIQTQIRLIVLQVHCIETRGLYTKQEGKDLDRVGQ